MSNYKHPNKLVRKDGETHFLLIRCFECPGAGERGVENYLPMVATGTCAFCGWSFDEEDDGYKAFYEASRV